MDEVSKSDIGRKIKEGVEEAAKTAKQSAESVTKGGEKLGKTAAFKAISQVHLWMTYLLEGDIVYWTNHMIAIDLDKFSNAVLSSSRLV